MVPGYNLPVVQQMHQQSMMNMQQPVRAIGSVKSVNRFKIAIETELYYV